MQHPEFDAYLTEARLRPELWRLLLGVLLIAFVYLGAALIIFAVVGLVIASSEGPFGIMPFLNGLSVPDQPGEVVLLLATFVGLLLGPILAAAALHFRGPGTLFGEFDDWLRGFSVALIVIIAFAVIGGVLGAFLDAPIPNLAFDQWLRWLPLAIPLLFLQISAEELVFRGYLQQQLAARFKSRWVWIWVPSVLFAALHWSPEAGQNLPLVLLAALTFGLIAADLTEATGSLGAAMGLHFGNNFIALLLVSMAETITGLSLYVTREPVSAVGAHSLGMAGSIIAMLGVWWVTKRILSRY